MKNNKAMKVAMGGIIAALYVVLTFVANAFGLANYAIQVRFSEALTILPAFTLSAIPGLSVGCLVANILTGCALPDIIFGTLATLIGALGTFLLRKKGAVKWLYPLPPIIANTIIVPFVLVYGYGIIEEGKGVAYSILFYALTVGIGEVISCGILGLLLYGILYKRKSELFMED